MGMPTWCLAAALAAVACGDSTMSSPAQMRSMIDDVRQENATHAAMLDAADTLAAVHDEMTRHTDMMGGMMGMMGDAMDGMSHCTGAGSQDLRDMHDGMAAEMDGHDRAIGRAVDLDAVTAEMIRHRDAMDAMLDGMDGATGHMACM